MTLRFVGWIEGKPKDRKTLRRLGVTGKMKYNEGTNAFEHCKITDMDTIKRLKKEYPKFWEEAFTLIDENNKIIPYPYFTRVK